MAEVVAGIGVSHIPALGVAMEGDASGPAGVVFEKFEPVRQWIRDLRLDTVIVIFGVPCAPVCTQSAPLVRSTVQVPP